MKRTQENDYGFERGPLGAQYCTHPDREWCDCDACHSDREAEMKRKAANKRARENRKARQEVMESCGLVRGKDSMGRTIWE